MNRFGIWCIKELRYFLLLFFYLGSEFPDALFAEFNLQRLEFNLLGEGIVFPVVPYVFLLFFVLLDQSLGIGNFLLLPVDGFLQARLVHGNGVDLIWAPDGPGWPRAGGNWYDAQQVCQYLGEDGLTPAPAPQHIWRLPTVDEAVRSMARHGQNSGGVWDAETAEATPVGAAWVRLSTADDMHAACTGACRARVDHQTLAHVDHVCAAQIVETHQFGNADAILLGNAGERLAEMAIENAAERKKRGERGRNIAVGIGALGLALWWGLYKTFRNKPRVPRTLDMTSEIPDDTPPALVSYLLCSKRIGGAALVGTLLDLGRRGVLNLREERVKKKSFWGGMKTSSEYHWDLDRAGWDSRAAGMTDYENSLLAFIFNDIDWLWRSNRRRGRRRGRKRVGWERKGGQCDDRIETFRS